MTNVEAVSLLIALGAYCIGSQSTDPQARSLSFAIGHVSAGLYAQSLLKNV